MWEEGSYSTVIDTIQGWEFDLSIFLIFEKDRMDRVDL